MKNFIDRIVIDLIEKQTDFGECVIIVPGKRPILYFKNAFQRLMEPGILPKFLSIEEFASIYSETQKIPQIKLWLFAYQVYQNQVEDKSTFADFIKWFPTLINDFNDIDTSLIDPNEIFDYLQSVERIQKWELNENLDENEVAQNQILFWNKAQIFYKALQEFLAKNAWAYSGKQLREAKYKITNLSTNLQFVFCGFNALTEAEHQIFSSLKRKGNAVFYWQADSYYYENSQQEAGFFLRKLNSTFSPLNWVDSNLVKPKNLHSIAVSKEVGQAKYISKILSNLPEKEITQTAIVLADETLLPAILGSIPSNISRINITMGMPLNKIPVTNFISNLFQFQSRVGNLEKIPTKPILDFLKQNFSFFSLEEQPLIKSTFREVQKNAVQHFSFSEFNTIFEKTSLQKVFTCHKKPTTFLFAVQNYLQERIKEESNDLLTKTTFYKLYELLGQIISSIQEISYSVDFDTLFLLFSKFLQSENLYFIGEPLGGLQITGLLETRLLEFKTLIICSVNEGILPNSSLDSSLIPFDIRNQYHLQTYLDKDAIFAYHFYRLIQNTKKAYFLYNTDSEGIISAEKSRFLRQLEWESPHDIIKKQAVTKLEIESPLPIEIFKAPTDIEQLKKWMKKGVSASSLINYLKNPIQFYSDRVIGAKRDEEWQEFLDFRNLGNLVHESLEDLYKPFLNQKLESIHFTKISQNIDETIQTKFETIQGENSYKFGRNFIAYQIVKKMVKETIKKDQITAKSNHLVIKELEVFMKAELKHEDKTIDIQGFIDRIDQVNGISRIIDYKTGSATLNKLKLQTNKLNLVFNSDQQTLALQLLFYAFLFYKNSNQAQAMFGIYPLRYSSSGLAFLEIDKKSIVSKEMAEKAIPYLFGLVEEILNPEFQFVEKV